MNSVVLCAIPGYQHNLVSDLVTMNVWDLFIQVHWGSWGESPCYRAQPPSITTLPSCHVYIQPSDWVINDQARGAIDNFWWLYTKAITHVTLAPVWEHLAVCCWPETQGIFPWQMYVYRACLPQARHCPTIKKKFPHNLIFLVFFFELLSFWVASVPHIAEFLYINITCSACISFPPFH